MTSGLSAFGTLFQIGDAATPTEGFTTIAEITALSGPGFALDMIEMTHHTSPGGWEEFVGGILRSGEVTFSLNFHPTEATHSYAAGLLKDLVDRTLRNFKMIFPDAGTTTWSFSGLVSGFEPSEDPDDKLAADVTVKLSGQPTLA